MKKSNIKTVIRQMVREEVAMAINEVITELKQPSQQVPQPKPKKKVLEKRQFTKNSILNEVMNETASEEWETMGGKTYDSSRMSEVISKQYEGTDQDGSTQQSVNPRDPMSQFLNKDYRQVLKKVDEKAKQTRG